MDAHTSHQHHQVWLLPLLLLQLDGEEVFPQLEVGFDPQIPLAQHDEG